MSEPVGEEITLSFVVPAYNESESARKLVSEVSAAAMAGLGGRRWEFVVVNDGSEDATEAVLLEEKKQCPQLRVISLKKRSGQTAAMDAGLRAARGRYIATLDADLQNDPKDAVRLLAMVESGECDLANGWRRDRKDPWIRLVSTKIANGVRNWLTHETIADSACSLKVFRRECIERVKFYNGLHRFVPTLVKMEGYRVKEVPVNHRPREAGVAKYGVWNRVFRALRDAFAIRWMQSRMIRYEAEERGQTDGR